MWEKIKGFDNFEVSDTGGVRNTKTGTRMKHTIAKNGMHRVTLRDGEKQKSYYVHDLVADAYFTGDRETREIMYRDGDYGNISIGNLILRKKEKEGIRVRETGRIFESRSECCTVMNIPTGALSTCLNNPNRAYKGYHYDRIGLD